MKTYEKKDCAGAFRSLALNSATYGYKSFRNALKTNEENAVKKPASEKADITDLKKISVFKMNYISILRQIIKKKEHICLTSAGYSSKVALQM